MKKFFILIITIIFISCNNEVNIYNDGNNDKELIERIMSKAVETVKIGSNTFVLNAYLWRDFMPVSPENGKPMISINWLVDKNSIKIPSNITMVKQYVIYNDEIWVADYEDEAPAPSLPEYKLERISRNGPKWGPKIYVDVISQIHDSKTEKDYYIILKNVFVNRTD